MFSNFYNAESLEIYKYLNEANLNAIIAVPDRKSKGAYRIIQPIVINDLSFSLGNKWDTILPIDDIQNQLFNSIGTLGNSLVPGARFAQGTIESFFMSSASWIGSEKPTFGLELLFFAYDESINPLDSLLVLSECALPQDTYDLTQINYGVFNNTVEKVSDAVDSIGNAIKNLSSNTTITQLINNTMKIANKFTNTITKNSGQSAPLGYGLSVTGTDSYGLAPIPNTTIYLQIGNWFYASELICERISNIAISKETTINGQPLYCTAYIDFSPYRKISAEEFKQYFKGYNNIQPSNNFIRNVR